MQYTVERTNVNLTPAGIRCTCRFASSSPSFSFLATSHSSLLSSLSQSLAPLLYCVCLYFSSASFCSYVHVQRWYLLETHDVVVWRFAGLECFWDMVFFSLAAFWCGQSKQKKHGRQELNAVASREKPTFVAGRITINQQFLWHKTVCQRETPANN